LRSDHFVPQTYLRGFVDPAGPQSDKPLHVYSKILRGWSRKSPRQICSFPGFDSHSDPTVASAFAAELWRDENAWPAIRAAIRQNAYQHWIAELPRIQRFLAYLTLRSPLFRMRFLSVFGTTPADLLDTRNQDVAVETARKEAAFLLAFLRRLNWTLFVGGSVQYPVITSDQPVYLSDLNITKRDLATAVRDGGFAIAFPVALDCCLVGSDQAVPSLRQSLSPQSFLQLWEGTVDTAMEYIISPVPFSLPGV
jgi:Protein of unknown function (DUF4238)